jgi:hypothetical protein
MNLVKSKPTCIRDLIFITKIKLVRTTQVGYVANINGNKEYIQFLWKTLRGQTTLSCLGEAGMVISSTS